MRANEFFVERRDAMFQFVKSVLPKWPDYVLKDWIYNLAKGNHQAGIGGWEEDPEWGFNRRTILKMIADAGLSPDTQWQLVPDMQFTLDMFEPKSKQKLIGRAGGSSDLGMGIPRDKERHATQAALAQQQGGVRKEPVILIKTANGYELLEGWHRTIQHFHMYPDGYTGPAYVAVSQGQQGVAENRLGTLHLGPLTIEIDDHALDRARQRGIDPYAVDRILKKLTTRLDKLEKIELGERFWVYDLTSNIALGIRRLNNNRYYLKTMIGTQPQLMPGISKIITLKL